MTVGVMTLAAVLNFAAVIAADAAAGARASFVGAALMSPVPAASAIGETAVVGAVGGD